MKGLVIYDSEFGNTEAIARTLAGALKEHGEVLLARAQEISPEDMGGFDLVVVGSPTQRHGLTPALHNLLEAIPTWSLDGATAVVFDTRFRMPRWLTGSAAEQASRKLKRLGCHEPVPPESFFVTAQEGPLVEGELDRAVRWFRGALELIGLPEMVVRGE